MYAVKIIYRPLLFLIDCVGYLLFWWIKFKSFKPPKKILCLRAENIGDVVLATPAFRALKQRFPDAEVDVLVRSFTEDVLSGNKYVDNVVVFDLPWLGLQGKKASWWQTLSFIRRLMKEDYDLVIDFHGDPRNILLSFLIGNYRFGFDIRGFGFLLNKIVYFNDKQHQIQINLDLVRALGAYGSENMDFFIGKKDHDYVAKLLGSINNFVVISPFSGRKNKLWLNKNWSELCNKLIVKYDCDVVFTGVNNDKYETTNIINGVKCREKIVDLVGKTSIKQLGAVIESSKLLICPDSGSAHIARALNVPLVALFSKEDPQRWGYDEKKFKFIWKEGINNIDVDDVLAVVKDIGVLK